MSFQGRRAEANPREGVGVVRWLSGCESMLRDKKRANKIETKAKKEERNNL